MELERRSTVLAGVAVVLVVVIALLGVFALVGLPDAGVADNAWGEVGEERIEILTTVWIDNPLGIAGDSDVEYDVELGGVPVAGGGEADVAVPSGRSTATFTTDFRYHQIQPWWRRHIENGEVSTAVVDATLHTSVGPFSVSRSDSYEREIETDIEGALDRGFSQFEGSYSTTIDRGPDWLEIEPEVEIENVTTRWGAVTADWTEIVVTTRIHNPNLYPIPVPGFTGSVEFNGVPVADWDADTVELRNFTEDAVIGRGETRERTFLIEMDNGNLPEWFATHVENGERTRVAVSGNLAMTIEGYEVTIPPRSPGIACSFDLTTAMFVEQPEGMAFDRCG